MARPIILFFVILLSALSLTVSASSYLNLVNTLTRQRINPSLSSKCETVTIPKALCTTCRMRKFNATGNFKNERDIYRLDAWACRQGLRRYAKLNPCDTPRVKQVEGLQYWWNRQRIAEFMYNICETCCDCVPKRAKKWEYWRRRRQGRLFFVRRGNCAVHVWYDTCRMWPNIRSVAPEGGIQFPERPQVCKLIRPWFFSKLSLGWLKNPAAIIPDWRIKRFLWQFVWALRCRDPTVWRECVNLETAQGRL